MTPLATPQAPSLERPSLPSGQVEEPRVVAGHRLLRRIGEGGMSVVYLGYDVPGRRPVAVKLLSDALAEKKEFIGRFYREARLSREQVHPNLVRGFEAGFDPAIGKHYLVMEYIDGPSAQAVLTHLGRLPLGIAVRLGLDIARALQFLHDAGYVHRDVKPDNVLLTPDGSAKLTDLGLARRLDNDSRLTSFFQRVGTTYYMPFEQALNSSIVDGRSDVYALGATLYHLLTGRVPFAGATHEEVVREKEQGRVPPARILNSNVPTDLEAILATALALDPRSRFQTADEFGRALEQTGLATRIPAFAWAHASPSGKGRAADADDPSTKADWIALLPDDHDPNRRTDPLLMPPAE